MTLDNLVDQFQTDEQCIAFLERLRWPNGVRCVKVNCHAPLIRRIQTVNKSSKTVHLYGCKVCGHHFSVTSGTIFHDSHLPLRKWFMAMLLMCEAKKGISAHQLKRTIGTTYKTAWFVCHRIREAMKSEDGKNLLEGFVEIDEAYIGSKPRKGEIRSTRKGNKLVALGMVQRGGEVRLRHIPAANIENVRPAINLNVSPAVQKIYTDEAVVYKWALDDVQRPKLQQIAHKYTFSKGMIHTNTVESAFSLLKRGVVGSFHRLSYKHLNRYLAEFEWRYNNRKRKDELFRLLAERMVRGSEVPYDKLVQANGEIPEAIITSGKQITAKRADEIAEQQEPF